MHDPALFSSSGEQPPEGIVLELHPLNTGNHLVTVPGTTEVTSSPRCQEEGPRLCLYYICTVCAWCQSHLRLSVSTSDSSLRKFQELLCGDLTVVCTPCARNGRR
ncbi:E7 protein [Bos taurus papillomavirus 7]|uniref:E7 protein n=1 Tax=Bos taurus papillomavirus 7 TaxID=1001533 RepID=Q30BJ2_9PAPI|nr:E7 protein [Bos taurus papillomavirus 7]ABB17197.1 E7 protein [Bos taurus papillomavirus 7]